MSLGIFSYSDTLSSLLERPTATARAFAFPCRAPLDYWDEMRNDSWDEKSDDLPALLLLLCFIFFSRSFFNSLLVILISFLLLFLSTIKILY